MATTPKLLLPYPDPNVPQWYAQFQAMVLAIDSSLYTPREDRNIIISGGGTMGFTASTGILTWAAPINLLASVTGFQWTIPIGQVTLQDGQLFYITVARSPQNNTTYTPVVSSITPNQPNGDDQVLIGIRIGTIVHFRDGFRLGDGQSMLVFDNTSSGGGGSGLDQLTGDVTAGPGTGSQTATVVGIQTYPVSSTPPTLDQFLQYNGSAWAPSSFEFNAEFDDVDDLSGGPTVFQGSEFDSLAQQITISDDDSILTGAFTYQTPVEPWITIFTNTTSYSVTITNTNSIGSITVAAGASGFAYSDGIGVYAAGGGGSSPAFTAPIRLTFSSSPFTAAIVDSLQQYFYDTSGGASILNFPISSSIVDGFRLSIKNNTGSWGTQSLTVKSTDGSTIEDPEALGGSPAGTYVTGSTGVVLSAPGGGISYEYGATENTWFVV
jgi:hypothetical protein